MTQRRAGFQKTVLYALIVGAAMVYGGVAVAQQTCADVPPADMIPAVDACTGYTFDGGVIVATNLEELTEVINGGAGVYIDYGFIEAAFQNYQLDLGGSPANVSLFLYNQGLAANAADLYDHFEIGTETTITDWAGSGEARYRLGLGNITIDFHELCFYGKIQILASGADALDAGRCLGEAICALVALTPVEVSGWGLELLPPYPNPTASSSTLRFSCRTAIDARLQIVDLRGRLVRQIAAGNFGEGLHRFQWDGCNEQGQAMPSGVYFCRMHVGSGTQERQIVLIR